MKFHFQLQNVAWTNFTTTRLRSRNKATTTGATTTVIKVVIGFVMKVVIGFVIKLYVRSTLLRFGLRAVQQLSVHVYVQEHTSIYYIIINLCESAPTEHPRSNASKQGVFEPTFDQDFIVKQVRNSNPTWAPNQLTQTNANQLCNHVERYCWLLTTHTSALIMVLLFAWIVVDVRNLVTLTIMSTYDQFILSVKSWAIINLSPSPHVMPIIDCTIRLFCQQFVSFTT